MFEPGVVKPLLRRRPCQQGAFLGLATGAHYIDCDLISYCWSCKYKFFYLLRNRPPSAITQLKNFASSWRSRTAAVTQASGGVYPWGSYLLGGNAPSGQCAHPSESSILTSFKNM